jgi:hypothetical protein
MSAFTMLSSTSWSGLEEGNMGFSTSIRTITVGLGTFFSTGLPTGYLREN